MRCPCCIGGEITPANICDVCGVGIAAGTQPEPSRPAWGRTRRRKQDQDERYDSDYTRTKEDKR